MFYNSLPRRENSTNGFTDSLPPRVYRSVWADAGNPQTSGNPQCWARPKRPQTSVRRQKSICKQAPTKLGLQAQPAPRPSTAPALLTGKGLLVQSSYDHKFLQQLENREVKNVINNHRKELQTQKSFEKMYDLPVEPHYPISRSQIYELSLHHGSAARVPRVQKSKSQPLPVADQLHELSIMLDGNTRHHWSRLGRPRSGGAILAEKRQSSSKEVPARRSSVDFLRESPMSSKFRACSGSVRKAGGPGRPSKSAQASVGKVAIILEEMYGTLLLAFEDLATDGMLSFGDWEMGVQEFGLDVDPADLFRHVNVGEDECMTAAEFCEGFQACEEPGAERLKKISSRVQV